MGFQHRKNGPIVDHLVFMDDLKLFAKSKNRIDSILKMVHDFNNNVGMRLRISKCHSVFTAALK